MSLARSYIASRRRAASLLLVRCRPSITYQPLIFSYYAGSFSTALSVKVATRPSSTSRLSTFDHESLPPPGKNGSASRTLKYAAGETASYAYAPLVTVLCGVAGAIGIAWTSAYFESWRTRTCVENCFGKLHDEMAAQKALLVQIQAQMQAALAPLARMSASLEKMGDKTRQLEIQSAVASALEKDRAARQA